MRVSKKKKEKKAEYCVMPSDRIATCIRIRLILLPIVASHGIIIVYRCPKQKGKQRKR